MWFCFLILSVIVEVYLWWKLQASHLFKWENLHNWWLTKYFFAPLYVTRIAKITGKPWMTGRHCVVRRAWCCCSPCIAHRDILSKLHSYSCHVSCLNRHVQASVLVHYTVFNTAKGSHNVKGQIPRMALLSEDNEKKAEKPSFIGFILLLLLVFLCHPSLLPG